MHRRGSTRFRVALLFIAVGGLALRFCYVWFVRRHLSYGGDPYYYSKGANLLAHGRGFINPYAFAPAGGRVVQAADHPPLYIVYLAAFSLLGVTTTTGHLLASAALGAASVLFAGFAGREMDRAATGLVAAALVAVYPNVWRYDGMLLSETPVIFLVLVVIWLAFRFRQRPGTIRLLVLGAVVGLATLARSELLLLVPLLIVPLSLSTRGWGWRRRVVGAAAGTALTVLVLVPWLVFNLTRFDQTVLLSRNLGGTLAVANCEPTYYGPYLGYWNFNCGADPIRSSGLPAFADQADAVQQHAAKVYIAAHVDRLPLVVAARLGRIAGVFRPRQQAHADVFLESTTPWVSTAGLVSYYFVAGLAIVGAVLYRRRRGSLLPLLAPIATVLITVAAFYAATRFRATAEPALCLLAAVALTDTGSALARAVRRRRQPLLR